MSAPLQSLPPALTVEEATKRYGLAGPESARRVLDDLGAYRAALASAQAALAARRDDARREGGSAAAAFAAELADLPDEDLAPLARRLAALIAPTETARPVSGWVSPDEAAEILRCRRKRIYELVGDGRLTRHGDGRRLLLRRDEVEQLAAGMLTAC